MRFLSVITFFFIFLLSANTMFANPEDPTNNSKQTDSENLIIISGVIMDAHHEPVNEAHVSLFIDGKPAGTDETSTGGKYLLRTYCSKEELTTSDLTVRIQKTSFFTRTIRFDKDQMAQKDKDFYITEDVMLKRHLGPAFWISTLTFILAYALISFELLHRTVAAMLGAAVMLAISYTIGSINPEFRIFSYEEAIHSIDMNVIFLLMGMMVIIGILKNTGVFQWCAYISYKLARGNVFILAIYLMLFTAFSSAFLDNVTTMLLLTSVTIEISLSLSLNPLVLLVPLIMASNVGGTATLIGDPPNIMIGSYAGLTFMQFVTALSAICILSLIVLFFYTKLIWGKDYRSVKIANIDAYTEELKTRYQITDKTLLTYGLAIMGFVIFLFLSHGFWHMEVSIAALIGASVFLTIAVLTKKVHLMELIEKDIEWSTLMFFIFLFIIVGAVESSGLLALVADWIMAFSQGNFHIAFALIVWVTAIMSAFVDNIPFTATMLPIVAYLSSAIPGSENSLWWALALGACFGGNGTIIGASANVVTVGIAESRGYKISFLEYMKVAFPYMLVSVGIGHAMLLLFR